MAQLKAKSKLARQVGIYYLAKKLKRFGGRAVVLLFRHNAQQQRMATSPQMVTRLRQPHTIVVRLHFRKIDVVIHTLEAADIVGA